MIKYLNNKICIEVDSLERYNIFSTEGCHMKKHKFWAWAAVICMLMATDGAWVQKENKMYSLYE